MKNKKVYLIVGLVVGLLMGTVATVLSRPVVESDYSRAMSVRCAYMKGVEKHTCHAAAASYDVAEKIEEVAEKVEQLKRSVQSLEQTVRLK